MHDQNRQEPGARKTGWTLALLNIALGVFLLASILGLVGFISQIREEFMTLATRAGNGAAITLIDSAIRIVSSELSILSWAILLSGMAILLGMGYVHMRVAYISKNLSRENTELKRRNRELQRQPSSAVGPIDDTIQPSGSSQPNETFQPDETSQPSDTTDIQLNALAKEKESLENAQRESQARITQLEQAYAARTAKCRYMVDVVENMQDPLDGILQMSRRLLATGLNDQQLGYTRLMKIRTKTLLGKIGDICEYAHIDKGKVMLEKNPMSLRWLVDDIVSGMTLEAESKKLFLKYYIDESLPSKLFGDARRIRQALEILITGAVRRTASGGIRLMVEREPNPAGDTATTDHFWVKLTVIDSGQSITQAEKDRMFETFPPDTDPRHSDASLEIIAVRQLVALMNGNAGLESEPGNGSIFWIALPLESDSQPEIARETVGQADTDDVISSEPEPTDAVETTFEEAAVKTEETISNTSEDEAIDDAEAVTAGDNEVETAFEETAMEMDTVISDVSEDEAIDDAEAVTAGDNEVETAFEETAMEMDTVISDVSEDEAIDDAEATPTDDAATEAFNILEINSEIAEAAFMENEDREELDVEPFEYLHPEHETASDADPSSEITEEQATGHDNPQPETATLETVNLETDADTDADSAVVEYDALEKDTHTAESEADIAEDDLMETFTLEDALREIIAETEDETSILTEDGDFYEFEIEIPDEVIQPTDMAPGAEAVDNARDDQSAEPCPVPADKSLDDADDSIKIALDNAFLEMDDKPFSVNDDLQATTPLDPIDDPRLAEIPDETESLALPDAPLDAAPPAEPEAAAAPISDSEPADGSVDTPEEAQKTVTPMTFDMADFFGNNHLRALVADGNQSNQAYTRLLLEQHDFDVQVTENSQLTIEALSRDKYDLVLVDLQMLEQDGFQALQAIRAGEALSGKRVPVIALTDSTMDRIIDECREHGIDGHLCKPINIAQFKSELQSVLEILPGVE